MVVVLPVHMFYDSSNLSIIEIATNVQEPTYKRALGLPFQKNKHIP